MSQRHKISACIHCRQMKLKCDAQDRFPASCGRCTKHKLRCSIDPSFKRIPQRQRINAMEKELQTIKASMEALPNSCIQGPQNNTISSPSSLGHPQNESPVSPYASPDISLQAPGLVFATQTIDGIEIQASDIAELLQRYYTHYHPHFPILADLASFVMSYDSCPLLFWTMIALGAKGSKQHANIYPALSHSVSNLAGNIGAHIAHPLQTVQALLILCWWPFTFQASVTNPSWIYCGLATHLGLQFGLHRSNNFSDFVYDTVLDSESFIVRQKTWLGCFITNQNVSSHIGVPATIHVDNAILKALSSRPSWLPPILDQHLKIAYHSYQICHALGDHDMTSTGLLPNSASTIQMFNTKLHFLKTQLGDECSCFSEIEFLRVQLQLFSFAFGGNNIESNNVSDVSLQTSEILVQANLSAMKIIQIASTLSEDVPFTANMQSAVAYAVFFLLKLSIFPQFNFIDQTAARNSISQAWNLFRSGSTMESDYLSRACAIIEYLSKSSGGLKNDGFSMMVESRMAANLIYDAVWRARERFSEQIKEAKPTDYTSAELESARQSALDFLFDPTFLEGSESGWDDILRDFQ